MNPHSERRRINRRPLSATVIVPFHNNLDYLARCLEALTSRPPDVDVIVASDGAPVSCALLARQWGAHVCQLPTRRGPAAARNCAAAIARGEILIFVDADVVVAEGAVAAMVSRFREDDGIAAVFGSYDDHPGAPGYFSQYKNLAHAFVHRTAAVDVPTFWAGFGGIRAAVFRAVNGFDESYTRPCIEDIELGTRLAAGGWRTVVDPSLQACHLKPWTFVSMVRSDIRDRAIPWTRLILQSRQFPAALNIDWRARASVALCWTAIICLLYSLRVPAALTIAALAVATTLWLNRTFYAFLASRRGAMFAVAGSAVHLVYHLYSGLSFVIAAADLRTPGRGINVDPGERVAAPASHRGGVNSRHATRGTR